MSNMSILHRRAAARAKDGMLSTRVMGIVLVTRDEIQSRANPVERNIIGLSNDIHNNLYFADPDELRKNADTFDALGNDFPGAFGDNLHAQAAQLRSQATTLDTRKSHPSAAAEKSFSESFFAFAQTWETFKASCVDDASDCGLSGNGVLDKIDDFYHQWQSYSQQYQALGYHLSVAASPSDAGDTKIPPVVKQVAQGGQDFISSIFNSSFVEKIIIGGVVLGGVYLLTRSPVRPVTP